MTKPINWKERCLKLLELNKEQSEENKKILFEWRKTIDKWKESFRIMIIYSIMFLVGGFMLGIQLGRLIG